MQNKEQIFIEDAEYIAQYDSIDWKLLSNKRILITGATGLIGATLVRGFMQRNKTFGDNIKVYALVRNIDKVRNVFSMFDGEENLQFILGDVNNKIEIEDGLDYIIHAASETSSKAFVTTPVETIKTAIYGTTNLIELAREKNILSMVYLSSMEVYGKPFDNSPLTEEKVGYLNPLAVRSSYSESKRMVENICCSYVAEYHVPIKIARLTQTFGPGVLYDDGRVFAEFARCVLEGRNIELQTTGESQRMYLYTAEAATAILTVLLNGENAAAYNVANPDTFCSIKEMADMVSDEFGHGKTKVVFNIPDIPNASYNPTQSNYLDIEAIKKLGWMPKTSLITMYDRMMKTM